MYSLRHRIARNLTINLLAVMGVLVLAMYFFTQQLLHDYILSRLQHDAESLASVLHRDSDRAWRIGAGQMSTVYDRVRSGHYYHVSVEGQEIFSRSLFDASFPLAAGRDAAAGDYYADGPGGERWLVWRQRFEKDGVPISVWIAEDIAPVRARLIRYSVYTSMLIAVVFVLLIYLQQRTLRDAFRVFEWLRRNLATIRQRETEKSGISIPDEIEPLVSEIEGLVEDLGNRVQRTRHAMGNLAHELKRPLQLLEMHLGEAGDARQREALDEIRNILERELTRARISGSSRGGGVFDIAEELGYMTDVLGKIYPGIELDIDFAGEIGTLDLDRNDMLEMIGNLLDNACKFARSSARLAVAIIDTDLELCIDDDGPGLEPEQLREVNRRGVRLDETVAGHGLGLGICRDILEYYRGDMTFERSSMGGLRVLLRIPLGQGAGRRGPDSA